MAEHILLVSEIFMMSSCEFENFTSADEFHSLLYNEDCIDLYGFFAVSLIKTRL